MPRDATRPARLSEDVQKARESINTLGERYLAGERLSAAQERKLRDALALVRRTEKLSAREIELRARRGWIR